MKTFIKMNIIVLMLNSLLCVQSAKILGIFPAPGYSQFLFIESIVTEAARRGHEVTIISPYVPKTVPKNYRAIVNADILETMKGFDMFQAGSSDLLTNIQGIYMYGDIITNYTLRHTEVQKLLHSDEHFDLVMLEIVYNEAMQSFAAHFNAPQILISSLPLTEYNRELLGVPLLPSINAMTFTGYSNEMTFLQRFLNVFGTIYDYLYRHYVHHPRQRQFVEKYFPNKIDFDAVVNNASLMFVNGHFTTTESSLLPYNVIEIGGCHVAETPLDAITKKYLDEASNGAILFSLGSNLKSSELPKSARMMLFKVFRQLKQRVLWKFETDLPDKPDNVYISKWLNQKAILGHPNLKLFVTHGGLLSVTESVFFGVPMLGIPVFIDQKLNMARAKGNGIAEFVPFPELSESTFSTLLNQMLQDTRYTATIKKMSSMMRDRPVKPLDLAIYWIEYVIRHRGFRSDLPTFKMYWFQVYMLDILVSVSMGCIVIYLILKRVSLLYNSCVSRNKIKKH